MKNKINLKQLISCAFTCLGCFALAPHRDESEDIKARHEESVRACASSGGLFDAESLKKLNRYVNISRRKNAFTYSYSQFDFTGTLTISHKLGTATFTFQRPLGTLTAVSCVVFDLLPDLFKNAETRLSEGTTNATRGSVFVSNIYNHHVNVYGGDFIRPYLTDYGMDNLNKVSLSLNTGQTMAEEVADSEAILAQSDLPEHKIEIDMVRDELDQSLSRENIKARHALHVRRCVICNKSAEESYKKIAEYIKPLMIKNGLNHSLSRTKTEGECAATLTITHKLGQVFFTFEGKQGAMIHLSNIVVDLLPSLFQDVINQLHKDELYLLKQSGNPINIYDKQVCKDHFISPYVTRFGMSKLESVVMRLNPGANMILLSQAMIAQPTDTQVLPQRDMHLMYMQDQALKAYGLYAHPVEHAVVESFEDEGEFNPVTRLGIVYGNGVLVFEFKGTLTQEEALSDLNLESLPELFTQNGKDLIEFGVLRYPNSFCESSRINKVELFMEPSSSSLPLMLQ